MSKTVDPAIRSAENFIRSYGQMKFKRLLDMFRKNEPGPKIAKLFNVSRQRVNQWKAKFGDEYLTFTIKPQIKTMVRRLSAQR